MSLQVPLAAGQLAQYVAECEGSIYPYPQGPSGPPYSFLMFQASAVVVFAPGVTPPDIALLTNYPFSGTILSPQMGMDLGIYIPNYYVPVSRSGAFQAPVAGLYTFVLYMWGGSTDPAVGTGNAAMVYPGTTVMSVIAL